MLAGLMVPSTYSTGIQAHGLITQGFDIINLLHKYFVSLSMMLYTQG